MTHKQIEAAREVRLWIRDIIVPAAAIAVGAMSIPEVREPVVEKFNSVKESVKNKLKKK